MTPQDLENLKDYILEKNIYFQVGYANAFKNKNIGSDSNGIIFSRQKSGDLLAVSPQDTFGNYFYMRNEEGFQRVPTTPIAGTKQMFKDTMKIWFVAFLREGDPMIVVDNITNTLGMYDGCNTNTQGLSYNWNREQIIIDELSGIKDDDIAAALQRLGGFTVVRLNFSIYKLSTVNNCIKPICTTC